MYYGARGDWNRSAYLPLAADTMNAHAWRAGPYMLDLAPGEYRWCSCGGSRRDPPFRDEHCTADCGLPLTVTRRSGTLWLCGCGRSKRMPICDASHNRKPK